MASAGPYASLHVAPDRQPRQHPTTQLFDRPDVLPAAQPTASMHRGRLHTAQIAAVKGEQWRRQDFVTGGGVKYVSIGGLEYGVPQSRLYCLCINVALCSTALQCICRAIRRSFTTMKVHTYYIIFGRPPIGGSFPLPPGGGTESEEPGSYVPVTVMTAAWSALPCGLTATHL